MRLVRRINSFFSIHSAIAFFLLSTPAGLQSISLIQVTTSALEIEPHSRSGKSERGTISRRDLGVLGTRSRNPLASRVRII
jgi:hypothetical protein